MDRVRRLVGVADSNGARIDGIPTGKGIGVAIVDTGIGPHIDFTNGKEYRIVRFVDFINKKNYIYDDCGHGTHVSGIVAGNGKASKGKYEGIAPEADIIAIKALNRLGNGKISDVLAAFQWIIDNRIKYNIRVVNVSMGTEEGNNFNEDSKLILGIEKLWESGVVVCVAAGNNGPAGATITMPGISRTIITVGCMDDDIEVMMTDIKVVDYSGRGPTNAAIMKPEVVAPGGNVSSCGGGYRNYIMKSGTSMATPVVSGLIALLLEKHPHLSNKQVKKILNLSAKDTGEDKHKQGWGKLDIESMMNFAKII